MYKFIKKNYSDLDSILLFIIILSFFLPSVAYSIRPEHFILYFFSIFILIKYFLNKNFYNNVFDGLNILFLISLTIFGLSIFISSFINFYSEKFEIINTNFNVLSFLSVTDNFIQPFL